MFLFTIPKVFALLESKSNWLLIKVIKLLMVFFKVEPRLGPKLIQKFTLLLDNPCAKSVLFEIIRGIPEFKDSQLALKAMDKLESQTILICLIYVLFVVIDLIQGRYSLLFQSLIFIL